MLLRHGVPSRPEGGEGSPMAAMRWWGWGLEEVSFTHEDKPGLGPFLRTHLDVDAGQVLSRPVEFEDLDVPDTRLPSALREALVAALGPELVSTEAPDRVVHARGKSLRDLVKHRRGELGRLPDAVVRPADEDAAVALARAAGAEDAVATPSGGGTNSSGSLEAPAGEVRRVSSADLGRLDRVLAVDEAS